MVSNHGYCKLRPHSGLQQRFTRRKVLFNNGQCSRAKHQKTKLRSLCFTNELSVIYGVALPILIGFNRGI